MSDSFDERLRSLDTGDVRDRDWRNDCNPLDIADNEVRSAFAQHKIEADTREANEHFHKHFRSIGADGAISAENTVKWRAALGTNPSAASMALRNEYLQDPYNRDRQEPKPPPDDEDIYACVKRSAKEAEEKVFLKDSMKRGDPALDEIKSLYGPDTSTFLRAAVNFDKKLAADPVGVAPKFANLMAIDNIERQGLRNAAAEIEAFAEDYPDVDTNPSLRKAMVQELSKMPNGGNGVSNALAKAYQAAKEDQRGYWYRNENARRDDIEDDIAVAARYARPAKSW